MSLKLGNADASLYLGSQPATAYLGQTLLTGPVARTLYFAGADDNDWANLANWFNDAEGNVPASSLPTAADSVIASASIGSNSGSEPTVANLTLNDPNGDGYYLGIAITVTGNATFNDSSQNFNGTVTGDATFNDSSQNFYGAVTGNATFNDSSQNFYGTVTGDATFTYITAAGGIATDVTGYANGTVFGTTFDATNAVITGWVFSATNNTGTVTGDATFNNSSFNFGTVTGIATFNDSSGNSGAVTGTATFNDNACNAGGTAGTFVPDPPPSCE